MEEQIRYTTNPLKVMMVLYNAIILLIGLVVMNDITLSFVLFMSLIGIQFHFTVFEDMRDKHLLNRLDLVLSVGTLVFLFMKFFVITAVG